MSHTPFNFEDVIDLTSDNERTPTTPCQSEPTPCFVSEFAQTNRPFARPWWHRLEHFVPAAAIEFDAQVGRGMNPRTGSTVYVDYLNQFNTDASLISPLRETKRRSERLRHDIRPSLKARYSEGALRGEWTTNAYGREVYRTSDGKEYVGMQAYNMHAKILTQKTQSLKVEERT